MFMHRITEGSALTQFRGNYLSEISETVSELEEGRIREVYTKRSEGTLYSHFNPGHLFMMHERERRTLRLLQRGGFGNLGQRKILEIGCGNGYWLRDFIRWGAAPRNLFGIDLMPGFLQVAKALSPDSIHLCCSTGSRLPFAEYSFDIVLQSTVFSSVLDPDSRRQIAEEMLKALKPGGAILWYDFFIGNPRNPDTRGISKAEVRQLFPGCKVDLRRITLAPPLIRLLASRSWLACQILEKVPFLRTHYLGLICPGMQERTAQAV
jgi:SAM-dependent methyltransferase